MNSLFTIETSLIKDADTILCEWGRNYCCIAAFDAPQKSITALHYITFDETFSEETINAVHHQLEEYHAKNKKMVFSFAFPEAVLVPKKFFNPGNELLHSLYDTSGNALHDEIAEWQVVNSYLLPPSVEKIISRQYPQAKLFHLYTPFLKKSGQLSSDGIAVDFNTKFFRVLVKKDGQLQLVQTYAYSKPLDVVYYLLKITEELGLSKQDMHIIVSGLIDEKSALYTDILQYFPNVEFAETTISVKGSEYPSHFFNTISQLARCVS